MINKKSNHKQRDKWDRISDRHKNVYFDKYIDYLTIIIIYFFQIKYM